LDKLLATGAAPASFVSKRNMWTMPGCSSPVLVSSAVLPGYQYRKAESYMLSFASSFCIYILSSISRVQSSGGAPEHQCHPARVRTSEKHKAWSSHCSAVQFSFYPPSSKRTNPVILWKHWKALGKLWSSNGIDTC